MGTARRKSSAQSSRLAFEALSIEGGLLSPEWLARLAQLGAEQQSESDYRVPRGLNLRDEIGRYWRIAQAWWSDFAARRARHADALDASSRFVTVILTDVFGFTSLKASETVERDGRLYPITAFARGTRVPVVIAAAGEGLDAPSAHFGDGGRRRSAFGLAQEFLNATDEALWGVVSDGVTLRILRDNASLTRPAWIEADLGRIFAEERYADFAALWLLLHETRFGSGERAPSECPLEQWRNVGREEGTRAREHLRKGVEDALAAFGQGFVAHPENVALRAALQRGSLTPMALYQELLRLAYRVIFLLTVEERGVLHPPHAPASARELYDQGYSLRRLRERAVRRSAHDRFADLWESLKIVFRGVARGEPTLALPALGGLFSTAQCPSLDGAKLANSFLLRGLFRLSWIFESGALSRVNWRDMGPEELGSVYESLLELVPQISLDERRFGFASGDESKGNARKTSGSYYTPDSLVQVLLDSALEPVVKDTLAANPGRPVEALLSLSVVDPACGSGHFLLAAARRLAGHVARLQANGTPSAAEYRHALRQVVGRCIYGVDLNPMAIELCRVGLWMEAVEPGLALSFLDSHIQHGNALLGATPELLAKGVPDAAWEPIEGDDKKVASALKKRNKAESKGQGVLDTLWSKPAGREVDEVTRAVEALDESPDADLDAIGVKASQWEAIRESEAFRHQRFVADAWCAAFVWPKQPGPLVDAAPTNGLWGQLRDGKGAASALTSETVRALAEQYRFFHWHLAFPQVFKRGGFDVVLGNPPWESSQINNDEYFASLVPEINSAKGATEKKQLIKSLSVTHPTLFTAYQEHLRAIDAMNLFIMNSGRMALSANGRLNLYRHFVETANQIVSPTGRTGMVIPSSFASDSYSSPHFRSLHTANRIRSMFDFENRLDLFPGVDSRYRFSVFCTLGAGRRAAQEEPMNEFAFYLLSAQDLVARERRVILDVDTLESINPQTRTAPTPRSLRDFKLLKDAHRQHIGLGSEADDGWGATEKLMFMAKASLSGHRSLDEIDAPTRLLDGRVRDAAGRIWVPLIEGKMVTAYDHRASSVIFRAENKNRRSQPENLTDEQKLDPTQLPTPMFWMPISRVDEHSEGTSGWFLVIRDVTGATNERTALSAVVPYAALTHSIPWLSTKRSAILDCCLLATLNSIPLDYFARQKVTGNHIGGHYLRQLPIIRPARFESAPLWNTSAALQDWILPRVLELTYTAWDLEAFAHDVGYDGPPFRWDPARRAVLRAELDAAFFHLYGLSRDDTDYVMETFPIVRKNDEKAHGEYRTKRLILEVYDAMAEAARTGKPYETRLDPPPADPRVAHPDTRTGTRS